MHTPTPWKREGFQLYGTDNQLIANFDTSMDNPAEAEEFMDNANLALQSTNAHAAIKEALAELIEEIQICMECGSLTDEHFITNDPLKRARQALTLANGGPSNE